MKNIKSIIPSAILAIALSAGCTIPMPNYRVEALRTRAHQTEHQYLELIIKEKRQDSDVCLSLEEKRILQGNHSLEMTLQKSYADKPYTLKMYDAQDRCFYQCKVPSHLEIKFEGHLPMGRLPEARTKVLIPYDARMNRVTIEHKEKCTNLLTINQLNK